MTDAKYIPAVAIPKTASSKCKDGTEQGTLHWLCNEEHRFIWFYRNHLESSRGDTYVDFNEYFSLPIRKDSIENTYERLRQKRPAEICEVPHAEPGAVSEDYVENTAGQVVTLAIEDTEDDTEEKNESYTDSTDEGMSTPALTHPTRNNNSIHRRTHIGVGGERSIKKSNSEPRQNRIGILISDSCSSKLRVKRRSSYQMNENGSPVSNSDASSPQIRRAARTRKVEFNIDSESNDTRIDKLLLERKEVSPNIPETTYGKTPLSYAAEKGHERIVKLLLEQIEVNPDIPDTKYGQTPLS
ncbi:hypothetical protein B9Z19DRAFT_1125437 [Tuber borchii]|uniref:Uncharacterized protein n=1 Tax=Tuber borchii TaxID=42251 RepID=A0A2T6ZUW1_TUBBO|nr:hypothetical protein B9Z19DRAFT_1125437 [Tuber borchii]